MVYSLFPDAARSMWSSKVRVLLLTTAILLDGFGGAFALISNGGGDSGGGSGGGGSGSDGSGGSGGSDGSGGSGGSDGSGGSGGGSSGGGGGGWWSGNNLFNRDSVTVGGGSTKGSSAAGRILDQNGWALVLGLLVAVGLALSAIFVLVKFMEGQTYEVQLQRAVNRVNVRVQKDSSSLVGQKVATPRSGNYVANYPITKNGVTRQVRVELDLNFHSCVMSSGSDSGWIVTGTGQEHDSDDVNCFWIKEGRMASTGEVYWIQHNYAAPQSFSTGVLNMSSNTLKGRWLSENYSGAKYTTFAFASPNNVKSDHPSAFV